MIKKVIIAVCAFAIGFFGFNYFYNNSEKASVEETNKLTVEQEKDWVSLFDGKTFNGWHGYNMERISECWQILDGAMVFTPKEGVKGGNLVTDKEYTNFELSLDWKISEAGNSGIFWGVHEDKKYGQPYSTGPEIQVLDDLRHSDGQYETHVAGSLYDMIAPSQLVVKEVGEWNNCIIKVNHELNEGSVTLNGIEIVKFPVHGEEWKNMIANSKFKNWEGFGMYKTGRIGLQDHGDVVSFKNIKIKEL